MSRPSPRGGPRGGGGGSDRGRGRGGSASGRGGASRGGGGTGRGGGPSMAMGGLAAALPSIPDHVKTIGLKRPGYVMSGKVIPVRANAFRATVPDGIIYHYDVVIMPSEKTFPVRMNMEIIEKLQNVTAPEVFTPRAAYDGRKNLFSTKDLFNGEPSREFDVLEDAPLPAGGAAQGRPPRIRKVRLTKANTINAELLDRYINGKESLTNTVLTAIMALNVVVRMQPTLRYPFNSRSFFTDKETLPISSGIELWRGFFQSVRPAPGGMIINVDISTGMMYKSGPLINVLLEVLGANDPNVLTPGQGLSEPIRRKLQNFVGGMRVETESAAHPNRRLARTVMKLSRRGANAETFDRDGVQMTIAHYFQTTRNRPLRYPNLICVETGRGGLIPVELCTVLRGQIMRKQVPPESTSKMVEFATMEPKKRFNSILTGLSVLNYGQSDYVRQFGITVDSTPIQTSAHVLQPPKLKYGAKSKKPDIQPRDGKWNMIDKQFFEPTLFNGWIIIVFERQQRFNDQAVQSVVQGLLNGFRQVGMAAREQNPPVKYANPQGNIAQILGAEGGNYKRMRGELPKLVVVILPENTDDVYTAVKHFGDVTAGVATQCLKARKCSRANAQYFANVCLKINVKLGGINSVTDAHSTPVLSEPSNPTVVMGADVMHPAPGSERPSFAALVGNVDSNVAKYVAQLTPQAPREEIITDLKKMTKSILEKYMGYRQHVEHKSGPQIPPKRLIFYRDGVSEGQFAQVLERELPLIKEACSELKIKPLITLIVVGKRHHIRFMPVNDNDAGDKLGNCPAGTVIDRDITHPTEFDYYLQSHAGLLGTSRPAHYSVLYDENRFNADALTNLSFALCHVYARATRSVSIPAPVYYADIVCSRAKNHYDPNVDFSSQSVSSGQTGAGLQAYQDAFKPIHANQQRLMYFS